jgi:hypothetical protein
MIRYGRFFFLIARTMPGLRGSQWPSEASMVTKARADARNRLPG